MERPANRAALNLNRVAGIVLAAGASTRMGEDKALLQWDGATLLERVVATLRTAGANPIRIVLGANIENVTAQLTLTSPEVVHNPDWKQGMLSSLHAGLRSLPDNDNDVTGALVWPVDHPCVSSRLVRQMIERFEKSRPPIVLPVHKGRRGHPTLFSAQLFPELLAAPLDEGARRVVRAHADAILAIETEEDGVLLNLNDRETYEQLLSRRPLD